MASREVLDKSTSTLIHNPRVLLLYINRLRNDESLYDIVFIVGNQRFPAHRFFMAAASPVLYNMLTNGMEETNQREVTLKEVNADVWRVVLNYIYTGQMYLDNVETALRYLECAKRFYIKELEQSICGYLKRQVDVSNCCKIVTAVDFTGFDALMKKAVNTLVENFYALYRTRDFSELSYDVVLDILGRRELVVRSELDVFLASVVWVWRSGTNRVEVESNAEITKRVYDVLKQSGLGFDGLEDLKPGTGDMGNYSQLFDCVDFNNLSDTDLRCIARFCRNLCKEIQTTHDIDLVCFREFGEKAVDKLLAPDNSISNVPIPFNHRVPHGRYDELFIFSQRYDDVHNLRCQSSPVFVDNLVKDKWYVRVHFRGHRKIEGHEFLSCFLFRKAEESSKEVEETEFASQIFVQVSKVNDGQSTPIVFSKAKRNDSSRNYTEDKGKGYPKLASLTALQGSDTVIVGVTLYFKPN